VHDESVCAAVTGVPAQVPEVRYALSETVDPDCEYDWDVVAVTPIQPEYTVVATGVAHGEAS